LSCETSIEHQAGCHPQSRYFAPSNGGGTPPRPACPAQDAGPGSRYRPAEAPRRPYSYGQRQRRHVGYSGTSRGRNQSCRRKSQDPAQSRISGSASATSRPRRRARSRRIHLALSQLLGNFLSSRRQLTLRQASPGRAQVRGLDAPGLVESIKWLDLFLIVAVPYSPSPQIDLLPLKSKKERPQTSGPLHVLSKG